MSIIKKNLVIISILTVIYLAPSKAEELKKYGHDYGLKLKELSQSYKEEWISDGVDKGSLITAINDVKLNTIADVKKALNKSSDQIKRITIIKNNGEKMVYRFR